MYVKRHRVRKGGRVYVYLRLVEAYRTETGQGPSPPGAHAGARKGQLKASGQLDQLAASFVRLDPPGIGTRRVVGRLVMVRHYLVRLGLAALFDPLVPMRGRSQLTHGEVLAVLVANRLCALAPLYDVAGWASSAAVAELFGVPAMLLNDDRLGRALEALAPVGEELRGELLVKAIRELPGAVDASRLDLDLTAVRFSGTYEGSALVKKGWAADRTITRQVKTFQASTGAGVVLYLRSHKGSESEPSAFMAGIETLAATLAPGLVVADSGLDYLENLCAIDAKRVRFFVPLRSDTGWAQRFRDEVPGGLCALEPLDCVAGREQRLSPKNRTEWKGLLEPFAVGAKDGTIHKFRVAYVWSSSRQRMPSPGFATGWAAATTRPSSRSTRGSLRSSQVQSTHCSA